MGPMPIVSVQPNRKFLGTAIGCWIGLSVGPLPERGLDEALGLAVGFWRIGLGADVLDAQVPASITKGEGFVTTAVVGHDAGDGDAEAFVVSHGRLEEGSGTIGFLVGLDLGERDAGVIVDADVDELPADAATVALAGPITGDAVTDLVETTELFDIDVDHIARSGPLIAAHRLARLQVADPVQSQPPQDAADGGRGNTNFSRDLLAGVALAAQCLDYGACGGAVSLGNERGLEERSRNPSTPSVRNRSTHLATIFGVMLN